MINKILRVIVFALALTAFIQLVASPVQAADHFITIGTGGVTGVYYPTGGAICKLVNKDRKKHGIRCSVESTEGSVYNIKAIRNKEMNFGVVQSDVQQDAIEGKGIYKGEKVFKELRALFSLNSEPMHLMARKNSGIKTLDDMKNKKINIGNSGSGSQVLAIKLLDYSGLSPSDFALTLTLKSSEQSHALCDTNSIDATIWTAGLPNGVAQKATSLCDVRIIPLKGANIDRLLAENPAFSAVTIPGGMYKGNPVDIPTWGPKATVVTTTKMSDEVVYVLVSAVFNNFDSFKKMHPAFSQLKESKMIKDSITARLHPGAIKYYEQRGWL